MLDESTSDTLNKLNAIITSVGFTSVSGSGDKINISASTDFFENNGSSTSLFIAE